MVRGVLTLAAEQLFAKTARHAANSGGTGLTYLAALCEAVARLGALLAARLAPTVQEVLPGLSPGAAPLMLDVLGALLAAELAGYPAAAAPGRVAAAASAAVDLFRTLLSESAQVSV